MYKDFDFERVSLYRVNYGATHGFNTLLFDLCRRSEFVMTMEEDWEWYVCMWCICCGVDVVNRLYFICVLLHGALGSA